MENYEKEYLEKRQKEYAELEAKVGKDETEILENGMESSYRWIYSSLRCIVTQETEQDEEARKNLEEDIRNMYSGHTIQGIDKGAMTIENGEKDMIHSEYYLELIALPENWEERLNLLEELRKDSRILWAEYDVRKLIRQDGGFVFPEGGISDTKDILTSPVPTMIPTSLPTQTTSVPTSPKTADVTAAFPWMITASLSLLVLVTLRKRKEVIE